MKNDRKGKEYYTRKARTEGKVARSFYKLEEINKRFSILKTGDHVLDLGCAPGSWTQYAAQCIGSNGKVIGYDLKDVSISLPSYVETRKKDIHDLYSENLDMFFDVILSDMAPNTTGDHKTDALRSLSLAEVTLFLAEKYLKKEGHIIIKLLEGYGINEIAQTIKKTYHIFKRFRPLATRKKSTEIFLIGKRFK